MLGLRTQRGGWAAPRSMSSCSGFPGRISGPPRRRVTPGSCPGRWSPLPSSREHSLPPLPHLVARPRSRAPGETLSPANQSSEWRTRRGAAPQRPCLLLHRAPGARACACLSVCLSFFLMVEKAWRPDLKGQELTCASYSGRKRK